MGLRKYKFWMVASLDVKVADSRHECRAAAEAQAKRLALENPQKAFAVMEAMTMYETRAPEVAELRLDFAPMAAPRHDHT